MKKIEWKILSELMKNSKISDRELADKIDSSQPTEEGESVVVFWDDEKMLDAIHMTFSDNSYMPGGRIGPRII